MPERTTWSWLSNSANERFQSWLFNNTCIIWPDNYLHNYSATIQNGWIIKRDKSTFSEYFNINTVTKIKKIFCVRYAPFDNTSWFYWIIHFSFFTSVITFGPKLIFAILNWTKASLLNSILTIAMVNIHWKKIVGFD